MNLLCEFLTIARKRTKGKVKVSSLRWTNNDFTEAGLKTNTLRNVGRRPKQRTHAEVEVIEFFGGCWLLSLEGG